LKERKGRFNFSCGLRTIDVVEKGLHLEKPAHATPRAASLPNRAGERLSRATQPELAGASWRPSAQLPPMERYGRFDILGRVGRGGMAEILLAREKNLAGGTRYLVIKRILPEVADCDEMLHMFLDEARVVMGLAHPNLCQIFEVGEQEGTWFIAMEWVHGATLHQLLRRALTEGMDYAVMARVVSQCAEALHHAHTARDAMGEPLNLVHRDVSPHNIMVAYDGRVKLLDFGIAKSAASTHHTEAGVVKGKVCYMAPEQWQCGPIDGRTDVFALGACLYEALTGRVVFKRDSQMEVMRAVLARDVVPLSEIVPDVPPALEAVVLRALAVKPEDRFQTALEMSEALEQFVSEHRGALGASQVAEYARRLFQSEVRLGPVMERSMYGADIAAANAPMLLPPVPSQLLGPPKPLPRNMTIPPPAFFGQGRATTPSGQMLAVSDDAVLCDADAATGPLRMPPANMASADESRLDRPERPSTFSDIPTKPLDAPLELGESGRGPSLAQLAASVHDSKELLARPLARTVSIPVSESLRRAMHVALPAAAAALIAVLGTVAWHEARDSAAQRPAAQAINQPVERTLPQTEAPLSAPVGRPDVTVGYPSEGAAPAFEARRGMLPELAADEGLLSLDTRPWSTVYLGKQLLGTTPLIGVIVPRGELTLKLVDSQGRVYTRIVPESEDETRRAFFDFEPSGSASTTAAP
jgi:serine/threonine protein kinase